MKRGQVFVRAKNKKGKWDSHDVLDLDDESFKIFIIDILFRNQLVAGIQDDFVDGERLDLRIKE